MSLFEYAQEVISRKLEKRPPMLRVSMDYMPEGGLSSIQQNLNINGQPHELSYINPREANLLERLGGSGEEVNGIPSYYSEDAATDAANTAAAAEAVAESQAQAEAEGEAAAYSDTGSQEQGLGFGGPGDISPTDPDVELYGREFTPISPYRGDLVGLGIGTTQQAGMHMEDVPPDQPDPLGTLGKKIGENNLSIMAAQLLGRLAKWGGFAGKTQTADEALAEQEAMAIGLDGDDYTIKKTIAAFKNVPIEEVTAEEVRKVKRLTNEQRVAGAGLEDILNQIYGPGSGAPMLGFNSDKEKIFNRVNVGAGYGEPYNEGTT
jgi:hypothetical protein